MRRGTNRWLTAFAIATYAFLFAPIVVLIIFSFNTSRRNFVWAGFTTDWYPKLFANDDLLDALSITLQVAFIAVIASTVIGSLLGLGPGPDALPRPEQLRAPGPAADGHARDHHGHQPADPVQPGVRPERLARPDHGRAHHLLHLVRGGRRPGPGAGHGSAPGGGRPRPGFVVVRGLLARHAPAHRAGRRCRGDARLRAVVRRPGRHLVQRGCRVDHAAASSSTARSSSG